MSDLQKYYQEKYGKKSPAPEVVSAFQDGQKVGAAFRDELSKLKTADEKKAQEGAK